MRFIIALLCMVLVLMASCVSAFPLSGGNGQFNATVLGTFVVPDAGGGTLYLDILFPDKCPTCNYNTWRATKVALVDADDKFYNMGDQDLAFGKANYGSPRRCFSAYNMPIETEIKRIRITPVKGDPFSIEWTGIPEVKGSSMSMKFYGPVTPFGQCDGDAYIKCWGFDVKISNAGSQKQSISDDQFEVVDQFGFHYGGESLSSQESPVDLMPGESMRFTVVVDRVSKLSRPVYLTHLPSNLTMDISAWVYE